MAVADGDITKVWSHKHGYPGDFSDMRTWNKTIQKMIDALELMKYVHSLSDDEERIVSEGL